MPQLSPEQQGTLTVEQAQKWDDRNSLRGAVKGLAEDFIPPLGPMKQPRVSRNAHLLLSGEHGGWDLDTQETLLRGAPGAIVRRHVRFDGTAMVEGVTFYSPGTTDNTEQLITVGPNAVVIFTSCRFYKRPEQPGTFIKVEAGGKVVLSGVDFAPTMTAGGTIIDNAGVALDVMIVGANRTGLPLGNASATGVV